MHTTKTKFAHAHASLQHLQDGEAYMVDMLITYMYQQFWLRYTAKHGILTMGVLILLMTVPLVLFPDHELVLDVVLYKTCLITLIIYGILHTMYVALSGIIWLSVLSPQGQHAKTYLRIYHPELFRLRLCT